MKQLFRYPSRNRLHHFLGFHERFQNRCFVKDIETIFQFSFVEQPLTLSLLVRCTFCFSCSCTFYNSPSRKILLHTLSNVNINHKVKPFFSSPFWNLCTTFHTFIKFITVVCVPCLCRCTIFFQFVCVLCLCTIVFYKAHFT